MSVSQRTEQLRHFARAQASGSMSRLEFYLDYLFEDIDLKGKTVLDVGGGDGTISFYAAANGARRVVCLEPASAGSTPGVIRQFETAASELKIDSVELQLLTFQDYQPGSERFDLVVLHNSINHLDESACERLTDDPAAVASYHVLLEKLASMVRPGGAVLMADCARRNALNLLGMPNPLSRSIEWHKHQQPELWDSLMRAHGFTLRTLRWTSPKSLGRLGRTFLGNRLVSFLTTSHFVAVFQKGD
jgi:2-polyprenyl-3-methyl-5-hydroxy-6-metoxy-1,4-benzoquinol methylase